MRTIAIQSDGLIAIMTQNSKLCWKTVFDKPTVDVPTSSYFFSMFAATPIYMVYGKKFVSSLTTTSAFISIVLETSFALFAVTLTHFLFARVTVVVVIRVGTGGMTFLAIGAQTV
jgi:hypothetical protein